MARRRRHAPAQVGPSSSAIEVPTPEAVVVALRAVAPYAAAPEQGARTPQPQLSRYTADVTRFVDVQIEDIRRASREAQEGDPSRLADLWLHMLRVDAHLLSVWQTRTAPVIGARWELSAPAGTDASAPAADLAVRVCEEALRQIDGFPQAIGSLLDAIALGFSVAEMRIEKRLVAGVRVWVPVAFEPVQSRRFAYSEGFELGLWDRGRAVADLEAKGWTVDTIEGRGRVMARLPGGKYVVHQPVTLHDYPTSRGLANTVARWWWAKQVATVYRLQGAEQFANPRFIGHIDQLAPLEVREEIKAGLESLAADGVVVLRGASSIDVLNPGAGDANTTWQSLVADCDAAMSKAFLGSTLNVEIGDAGGNRAAAESQGGYTIDPRMEQDGSQLWATLRRDVLAWILAWNRDVFPVGTPVPQGAFVFAEEPVEIDDLVVNAGVVTVDELRLSRGLPALGGESGDAMVSMAAPSFGGAPAFAASPVAPPAAPLAEVSTPDPFAASRRKLASAMARGSTSRTPSRIS